MQTFPKLQSNIIKAMALLRVGEQHKKLSRISSKNCAKKLLNKPELKQWKKVFQQSIKSIKSRERKRKDIAEILKGKPKKFIIIFCNLLWL